MKRLRPLSLIFLCACLLVLPVATFAQTINCTGVAAWAPNTSYSAGALVVYNGAEYKCVQAHTSETGWEPPNVPALWSEVGTCGSPIATPTATPTLKPTPTPTATPTATKSPTATPTPIVTPTPIGSPAPSNVCAAPWAPDTTYAAGAIVSYSGINYKARVSETSEANWQPPDTPALWQSLGSCATPPNQPTFSYWDSLDPYFLLVWNPNVMTSYPIDHYNLYPMISPGVYSTSPYITPDLYYLTFGGAYPLGYELIAVDTAGISSTPATISFALPIGGILCVGNNPPTGLTATSVSSTSVTLTWTAPVNTGGSSTYDDCTARDYGLLVDGTTLTYTKAAIATSTGVTPNTTATITGLTPNTVYQLAVSALGPNQLSAPSAPITVMTTH